MALGRLYMIPILISDGTENKVLSPEVRTVIPTLDYFLVENIRTARRFISALKLGITIEDLKFEILDKKTNRSQVSQLLLPLKKGRSIGILSESGCPGIADPGALAVDQAHRWGVQVKPLVGPSSILLALMASGLEGQRFAFHGYLPVQENERKKALIKLEQESRRLNQTQIFIETPYRNEPMFKSIVKVCIPETRLCIARDVSGERELIKTDSIRAWKKTEIELHKLPVVFLILA